MSMSRYVMVRCDRCHTESTPHAEGARATRKAAKEAKWRLGREKDYCPHCAANMDVEIADAIARVKAGNL